MPIRMLLMAALALAPFAVSPSDVAAQQRGVARPEAAGAPVAGQAAPARSGSASPSAEPRGLQKAFEGRTPPAALKRLFPALFGGTPQPVSNEPPAAEPAPSDPPTPEPAPCGTSLQIVGGQVVLVDCHGNVIQP